MILSVHIPKTAGTSFKTSLQDVYGDRCLMDYGNDKPMSWLLEHIMRRLKTRWSARRSKDSLIHNYDVIHGHYSLGKYRFLPQRRTAAFFRDPVNQAVSHYTYVARDVNPDSAFHRKVYTEKAPFRDYLRMPNYSSSYRIYLSGRDPQTLDFVGITEEYADSVALFERIFGVKMKIHEANKNEDNDYTELIDAVGGRKVLEDRLAVNMHYYKLARQRFDDLRRRLL